MSASLQSQFSTRPISCFSFNADRSQVALSLNDAVIYIFKHTGAGKWAKTDELREHTGKVTGVSWAPKSNQIVSCGADRNAYVWKKNNEGVWKQVMVLIRVQRGAITVKWSPQENKFAIGTAARLISICYYEAVNNWWVCKHIKKPIRSSVLSLSWHPNNILLAAGTSDFKCRVFSTYLKEIEEKPAATSWGKKMSFANLMGEFGVGVGGWIHGCSFSDDGERLAFVGHDSSVSFVQGGMESSIVTRSQFLPFTDCTWISANALVAVGFDCNPMVFNLQGDEFVFSNKCDDTEKKSGGSVLSGRAMFQAMDRMATSTSSETIKTKHKNTILSVARTADGFATAGADGQIIQWNINSLASKFSSMKL
ncbi:unnamed protein product [Oikopleura dioica]|uniref:Actin-related protein 2/3 complex subunit n=1 Tax=Oikopleura dioica TaxID=34765 RepID=E4XPX6_OIKDI|nr:unnamed protein product [Oikopleura dioica]